MLHNDGCYDDSLACGAGSQCLAAIGYSCTDHTDCASSCCANGICHEHASKEVCAQLEESAMESCKDFPDFDCLPFLECGEDFVCRRPEHSPCIVNEDCTTWSCNGGVCAVPLQFDDLCDLENDTCQAGELLCTPDSDPTRVKADKCKKVNGQECFFNEDCADNYCIGDMGNKICSAPKEDGEDCSGDDADEECLSGRCDNMWYDQNNFKCLAALDNGSDCDEDSGKASN